MFVLVSVINHVSVDVENTVSINEVGIEPAMERQFLVIVKLKSHIIIYKNLFGPDEKVIVRVSTNQFNRLLLLFAPIIENMAFTYDFKVREPSTLC